MGASYSVPELKRILSSEVNKFCNDDGTQWKKPIHETINELKETNCATVIFGGTLRTLLISKCFDKSIGKPRDIDLVVEKDSRSKMEAFFSRNSARENRFGGYKLNNESWEFDVWSVEDTWSFKNSSMDLASNFQNLPYTTFFNLEAIAVEAWKKGTAKRRIYSGDDRFFKGIANREIEINNIENPFPELCVVRALLFASVLDFKIGPQLLQFICDVGGKMSENDLEQAQISHYGIIKINGEDLREMIHHVVSQRKLRNDIKFIRLPLPEQLPLRFYSDLAAV